jgi:Fe-S cluster assembly ATP-binding protein
MHTLELKDISVVADNKTLVEGASLTLRSGEVHILMGPNGSGKSSLLNAIMGHPKYQLTGGSVVLDNEDITILPTEGKAKAGLFLSLQHLPEIAGVSMTSFLHRAYKEMKGSPITPLEFYKMAEKMANDAGLDAGFLKKHVNTGLSGGEKKQSEVLQLLVLEPKFAFLDEIDSGVDVDAMKKVYAGINMLKEKGIGFLLVTHFANILDHVTPDMVHVMRGGKVVASGGKELIGRITANGFDQI